MAASTLSILERCYHCRNIPEATRLVFAQLLAPERHRSPSGASTRPAWELCLCLCPTLPARLPGHRPAFVQTSRDIQLSLPGWL